MTRSALTTTALTALFAAGCGGGTAPPGRTADSGKPGLVASVPNQTPAQARPPAAAAAADFLKAVADGKVGSDGLSPAFRKVLGPPVLDSDKSKGYDADAVLRRLREAGTGKKFADPQTKAVAADAAVFTGPALAGNTSGRYLLRLVPAGDRWQADWFQVTAVPPGPSAGGDPFAEFAARAFLDAVLAKDADLAAAAMTPALKKQKADPFPSDVAAGRGYAPGLLAAWVGGLLGDNDGYTLTAAGPDTFKAALTGKGKTWTYAVKLAKGTGPGEWLVEDVKAE